MDKQEQPQPFSDDRGHTKEKFRSMVVFGYLPINFPNSKFNRPLIGQPVSIG